MLSWLNMVFRLQTEVASDRRGELWQIPGEVGLRIAAKEATGPDDRVDHRPARA